jgi:hypothetical protein
MKAGQLAAFLFLTTWSGNAPCSGGPESRRETHAAPGDTDQGKEVNPQVVKRATAGAEYHVSPLTP